MKRLKYNLLIALSSASLMSNAENFIPVSSNHVLVDHAEYFNLNPAKNNQIMGFMIKKDFESAEFEWDEKTFSLLTFSQSIIKDENVLLNDLPKELVERIHDLQFPHYKIETNEALLKEITDKFNDLTQKNYKDENVPLNNLTEDLVERMHNLQISYSEIETNEALLKEITDKIHDLIQKNHRVKWRLISMTNKKEINESDFFCSTTRVSGETCFTGGPLKVTEFMFTFPDRPQDDAGLNAYNDQLLNLTKKREAIFMEVNK